MIQFIHKDIKEKESCVNNLLETTLIYSKKQAHIYIYIQAIITQNIFQGSRGGGIASPSTNSISFSSKGFCIKSCLDFSW